MVNIKVIPKQVSSWPQVPPVIIIIIIVEHSGQFGYNEKAMCVCVYYLPNLTAHVCYFPNFTKHEYYFLNSTVHAHYHIPHFFSPSDIATCLYQFAVILLAVTPCLNPSFVVHTHTHTHTQRTTTTNEGGSVRILRISDNWGSPYNAVSLSEIVRI